MTGVDHLVGGISSFLGLNILLFVIIFNLKKNPIIIVAVVGPAKRIAPSRELLAVASVLLPNYDLVILLSIVSIDHP